MRQTGKEGDGLMSEDMYNWPFATTIENPETEALSSVDSVNSLYALRSFKILIFHLLASFPRRNMLQLEHKSRYFIM